MVQSGLKHTTRSTFDQSDCSHHQKGKPSRNKIKRRDANKTISPRSISTGKYTRPESFTEISQSSAEPTCSPLRRHHRNWYHICERDPPYGPINSPPSSFSWPSLQSKNHCYPPILPPNLHRKNHPQDHHSARQPHDASIRSTQRHHP